MVGRLALELQALLSGARITELRGGALSLTVALYRRQRQPVLYASFDPQAPLAAVLESAGPANESGPGSWAGGVAPLLRGSVVDAVHAVPNDRILNIDVSSRSAFGVPARHRIVLELEPRKANALVLRPMDHDRWTILAAAKEFEGSDGSRAIEVGEMYAPPPARRAKLDRAAFLTAVDIERLERSNSFDRLDPSTAVPERSSGDLRLRSLARLLGEFDPTCTPPLAREVIERALERPNDELGYAMLDVWGPLREQVAVAAADFAAPIFAYRRGSGVATCHVVSLTWPPGEASREKSLNALCAQELERGQRTRVEPAAAALRKRLELMLTRCDAEVAGLRAALDRADRATELRAAGDALYAGLADIEPGSTSFVTADGHAVALNPLLTPKQNAADYFKRYKRARSGLPRIKARLAALAAHKEHWEQLLWELDRADAQPALRTAIHADVTAAISKRKAPGAADFSRPGKAKRKSSGRMDSTAPKFGEGVLLSGGATAFVGRSPKDNERLTFVVARPNDYWFHARGIPGAHVILKLAHAGETPTQEQLEAAAALAAGASRASDAGKVEVDYTQRKHVRRQGKGATGLVWYTDVKTILVTPKGP